MPHIHEKIDFTTSVFIVNGDAVLLRKHEKYHHYLPPGGHIELSEDPNEAVLREAEEETGLRVTLVGERSPATETGDGSHDLVPPRFINRHHATKEGHEHVDLIYFATSATRTLSPRPEEGDVEMHWFSMGELSDPAWEIYPSTRHYATAALAALASGQA